MIIYAGSSQWQITFSDRIFIALKLTWKNSSLGWVQKVLPLE